MHLDDRREGKIKRAVLGYLEHGRPGWDVPHTLATVHWAKELLKAQGQEDNLLIVTAYFHDIGWSGLKIENSRAAISNGKNAHMENGVIIAGPILKDLGFEPEEIKKILRLIGMHDKLSQIKSRREQLLFEADSLGQIDIERVISTFNNHEERVLFIRSFITKRVPHFKTDAGKAALELLLETAKDFYCA